MATDKHTPREQLSGKQVKFVDAYTAEPHLGANAAAEKAGYHPSAGSRLLHHPTIAAEVAKRQAVSREKSGYTVEVAMKECEHYLTQAAARGQFMAAAKFVELRTKLQGLLIEKHDVRTQTNFRINILGMPVPDSRDVVPSPFVNVEGVAAVPLPLNPAREVGPVIDDTQFDPPAEKVEEDIFGL